MRRVFARCAEVARRSGQAMLAAGLLAAVMTTAPARAQDSQAIDARSVVETLYTVAGMMEKQGVALEGGGYVPTSFRAFLAPDLVDAIIAADDGFRPLVGASEGAVEDYMLQVAQEAPDDPDETIVEAAVDSQGKTRLVRFSLQAVDGGKPMIVSISGDGWVYGGTPPPDAAAPPDATAPEGGAGPSAEEQAALAAADGGTDAAPAAAGLALPFTDGFDGSAPGPAWTVLNETADKYVVEGGVIYQIATGGNEDFRKEGSENIFRLSEAPEGDFDMTVTGLLEAKTGYEGVWLGLYDSAESFVAANLYVDTNGCGRQLLLRVVNRQPLAGTEEAAETVTSEFGDNLFDKGPLMNGVCSDGPRAAADGILQGLAETGFALTLSRRGFRYVASVTLQAPAFGDFAGGTTSTVTREVARLTPAGTPAFTLGQFSRAGSGETVVQFDSFSITAPAS